MKDYSSLSKEELIQIIEKLESRKKYGLIWDEERVPEQVAIDCKDNLPVLTEIKKKEIITDESIPTNILIEGDNYHALSVLNYTHKGKIDLIYIDPPYNTGAKDWKYNNNFVDINDTWRHSKWINFMYNRLILSKNLLTDNGALICAIDENEMSPLGLLLDELFPAHERHCITIVHNPRGIQGTNFSYTHEYAYFVIPKAKKTIVDRKIDKEDIDWRNLRDNGGESLREDARNCFYAIIINNDGEILGFSDVIDNKKHPDSPNEKKKNEIYVYPIDKEGIERKWRYARQSVEDIKHLLRAKKSKGIWQIEIGKDFGTYRTVWIDSRYDSNEYGKKIIGKMAPGASFDFPKSLWNVYDCIYAVVGKKPNAIVLDYFAGSGTTGHAVLTLNNEDNGNRQFILCTNNENLIAESVTYPRIKSAIKGYKISETEKVKGLIGNLRYFKTSFVSNSRNKDQLKIDITKKCTEMLCLKESVYNLLKEHTENDEPVWKIFKQNNRYMAVYYDFAGKPLESLKKEMNKISGDKVLYCFTTNTHGLDKHNFTDWENIRLEPIPQKILDVYKRIFKGNDK
ncbi:MAG TPA: site-specific DNA-methyltransferase [Chitinophagales bacterium]|nr:site-specific DNA-methyltransferase [Chitinophagales bacterium]